MRAAPIALRVLAGVTVCVTLAKTRAVFAPVAVALVLSLVLSPIVESLNRRGVPRAAAGGGLLAALVLALGLVGQGTWQPAREWMQRIPTTLSALQRSAGPLQSFLNQIQRIDNRAQHLQSPLSVGRSSPIAVVNAEPGPVYSAVMGAPALITGFLGTVFMSFFMLTSGPELIEQLASSRGTGAHTAQLLVIVRSELARYLGCLTLINVGVALAVILLSAIMGLPNPFLWGVLAFGLNFIPYAGPAVMMATLFIASFNTFGSIAGACTVAAAYLGISTIDGQIVQPLLVGSRLALSPLIVFLALWFAGWLWGFLGIALAVPLLTILKATVVHLRPQSRLAALLDSGAYRLRDRLRLQARTGVGTKPVGAS